jgi:phytoene/squalene synthetase
MIDHPGDLQRKLENVASIESFLKTKDPNHHHPAFRALLTLPLSSFAPLNDLLDGFKQDIQFPGFKNEQELYRYCYQVASTIGLVSIDLFGCLNLGGPAKSLGLALQLVNIARDVAEDWNENQRVYLINTTGNQVKEWLASSNQHVEGQIGFLLQKYESIMDTHGIFGAIDQLPIATRRAVLSSFVMYDQIAQKLAYALANRPQDLKSRVRVPKARSLFLLLVLWFCPRLLVKKSQ